MRGIRRSAVATLLALVAGAAAAPPAAATRPESTITVVARGLNTPRGLLYDLAAHRVLVAEAGAGGPSRQHGGDCARTTDGSEWCYGPTGAVLQFTERDNVTRRIAERLPSIGFYDETGTNRLSVIGAHDLVLDQHGRLRVIFGLTGDPTFRTGLGQAAAGLGRLNRLSRPHGHQARLTLGADLAAFEQQHNPDHNAGAEANPYGVAESPLGTVVVDASGNDLLLIPPNGAVRTLAVFPSRVPAADPSDRIDSVPTTVALGPDGAFYVGELTGYPYYKGEARVWRVIPGRAPTVFAAGFTSIADLTFDERGRLTVLEMAKNGLSAVDDPLTGRLVRLEHDGARTELATTGLVNPGGVAYAGGGVYYVTNRTTSADGSGELLRVQVWH